MEGVPLLARRCPERGGASDRALSEAGVREFERRRPDEDPGCDPVFHASTLGTPSSGMALRDPGPGRGRGTIRQPNDRGSRTPGRVRPSDFSRHAW